MLKKYNLVRRREFPNEENLIVGDRKNPSSVRVYKYVEKQKAYVFLKIVKDVDLKYTGSYVEGKAWLVPPLLEKAS